MPHKRTIVLLVLLMIVAGVAGYQFYTKAEEERIYAAERAAARERRRVEAERRANEPAPDSGLRALPTDYRRPASAWRSNEKAFYQEMLSKGRFEWLVVPFQVQDEGTDRATRSIMAAQLAMAVAAAKNVKVPDPYLVSRALGDGERGLNLGEVYQLANRLGVKRIVWGYVGHNGMNTMRLTIRYQDRGEANALSQHMKITTRNFAKVAFSDENPPIEVFRSLFPEILKAIGLEPAIPALPETTRTTSHGELPSVPLSVVEGEPEPVRDALYLQLLAVLAPRYGDRTMERLIEKSLLAIYDMPRESPHYRVLKARAFMYLGLRPAALKVLGSAETPEEQHLLAVLNGNLPDAQRLAEKIKDGPARFIASAEVNRIAVEYRVRDQKTSIRAVESLRTPGPIWSFLAVRAFTDPDPWSQHENAVLKALLDREFPLPGYSLESTLQGLLSLGDMARAQDVTNLSVLNHVRQYLDSESKKWCCIGLVARPSALDYLDLIESLGTDNLMRRARFLTETQGLPESALDFLSRIESAYKDHPQYVLARASAEFETAKRMEGSAREGRVRSAYANAFNAFYWEQGQTPTAADAFKLKSELGGNDHSHNIFTYDFPHRSYFPAGGLLNSRAALGNSTNDWYPVRQLSYMLGDVSKEWDKVDELVRSIEGRFSGHPARLSLMAKASLRAGDVQSAQRLFRAGIQVQPRNWELYLDLGKSLLEEGSVTEAAGVFMSYPGFKKGATENPVHLSIDAFNAGSLFFWTGHFAQAIPLYRISAQLRTGSNASLTSDTRLRLIEGDFAEATTLSFDRARRYNSPFGYRDYLGLLHATGRSKPAWDAFNVLAAQMNEPQIWETALVGHRIEGLTESQIADWAGQERMRASGQIVSHAEMYFLRAGVTDRMPSKGFVASLEAMDRPVWKLGSPVNHVVRPARDGETQYVLGPSIFLPGITLTKGVFTTAQKTRVKSELVYFAEGYRAIRGGDFQAARAALQESATLYDLSMEWVGYILPYYAYASAKTGDATAVRQLLDGIPPERRLFDYHLARAVLAGLTGDAENSLRSLKLALYRRPFTESRPFYTEYQYAELCEWLYEATRNTKYRDVALDWARKNQTFQPWFAWAYAMEAKLSPNVQARGRAIAMTYYLDKNSERLSAIPKREVDAAVRNFQQGNPFLRTVEPRTTGAT